MLIADPILGDGASDAAPGTTPNARALVDHLAKCREGTLLAKLPDPDCAFAARTTRQTEMMPFRIAYWTSSAAVRISSTFMTRAL